jgi:hypothetical protein
MACTNTIFAYNTTSIEKLNDTNYPYWKMKVQIIFLKSDLIGIIDEMLQTNCWQSQSLKVHSHLVLRVLVLSPLNIMLVI